MGSSSSVFRFLELPRELRDMIYRHWYSKLIHLNVIDKDGYVYDFERNKLTHANGGSINLSLSLTCRQISSEIAGMALGLNEVVFRTYCSKKTMYNTGMYGSTVAGIGEFQARLLNELAPQFLTSDIVNRVATRFPQFYPILQTWQEGRPFSMPNFNGLFYTRLVPPWGETRSSWVAFNHLTLSAISGSPNFLKEAREIVHSWVTIGRHMPAIRRVRSHNLMAIIDAHPDPWAIPTTDEVLQLRALMTPRPPATPATDSGFYSRFGSRMRYSAASLAIRFLRSHQDVALPWMRKIVLLEDRMSVISSPSHAYGLIQFCQKNPRLRIERIANLWEAVISPDNKPEAPLRTSIITKSFGRWIFEALELRKHGMPEGSFRLLLDGNPIPHKASEVFEAVKGDAVRQAALDLCYERNLLPCPSWAERRERHGYQWEGLPQTIKGLLDGVYTSFIDCNFDLGEIYDPERLISERLNWSAGEWEREWALRQDDKFDTEPPLPTWLELHPMSTDDW